MVDDPGIRAGVPSVVGGVSPGWSMIRTAGREFLPSWAVRLLGGRWFGHQGGSSFRRGRCVSWMVDGSGIRAGVPSVVGGVSPGWSMIQASGREFLPSWAVCLLGGRWFGHQGGSSFHRGRCASWMVDGSGIRAGVPSVVGGVSPGWSMIQTAGREFLPSWAVCLLGGR